MTATAPELPHWYPCCDHCCHEYDPAPHPNPCAEGCNDDEN